ncbi:hypothetical protein RCL_jg4815.t1 [Rhizophagus clarus]|uniref:SHSP domain-containing protein n=1 Tax=Rhizophagus clarus TaxID=94130 RepID=A0A8H3MCV7_9GLOM|nr:hypothetical protein RCL_jg4815.t1 [Rhizophagus clarus]
MEWEDNSVSGENSALYDKIDDNPIYQIPHTIFEKKNIFIVVIATPGIEDKSEFTIHVSENMVVIEGMFPDLNIEDCIKNSLSSGNFSPKLIFIQELQT